MGTRRPEHRRAPVIGRRVVGTEGVAHHRRRDRRPRTHPDLVATGTEDVRAGPIAPGHHRPQTRVSDVTFDDGLAERLRHRFASVGEVSERRMFGGLAFLVAGNMCVGIMGSELIARIGVHEMEAALARHGVRPFEGSGRPMRGWVTVGAEAIAETTALKTGRAQSQVGTRSSLR